MPTTISVNVILPAELAAFVEGEVAAGGYDSAEEVVRDALRLLRREQAAAREERLGALRREVAVGLADVEAGRVSSRSVADIAEALLRGGA
jgi:antitoxin ParD1/3/4